MLSKIIRKVYGSYIPIINIEGTINNAMTQKIQTRLNSLSVANSQAIAVSINSTGGLPVQSQIIGRKLKNFARNNHLKLLTFGRDVVTSGAYLILAHGDQVYCDMSSVVGSIGVTIPKYDVKQGLQYFSISQQKLKSNENLLSQKLSPFHKLTQQEKKQMKQVCESMHTKLISKVKQLRTNKLKSKVQLFDGSIFTGQQSKQYGLVDEVGSMVQILQRKYPGCKLGVQKQNSIWNAFLKTN